MTIAQVRALNIVAASKAHEFLFEAHMFVTDVRSLFFNGDDFATAARLKEFRVASPMRSRPLSG